MITNISTEVKNATKWFVNKIGKNVVPSESENIIRNALNGYNIIFHTEVSFKGLKFSSGGYARFDFWIPERNTLIEYNGKNYHENEDVKERDKLKIDFCKKHKIKLIVFTSKHYFNLDIEVCKLIKLARATNISKRKIKSFDAESELFKRIGVTQNIKQLKLTAVQYKEQRSAERKRSEMWQPKVLKRIIISK